MMVAAKLTVNQVLLNEYIKQEYCDNPEYANREDDFFEFFAAAQVLKDFVLSDEEIENGICGGSLDGGCDAIYLFADGILQNENVLSFDTSKKGIPIEFCIIQAKNSTSFGEDPIMKWKTTFENLFNMETDFTTLHDRYNEKVCDSFDLFRKIRISMVRKNPKINIKLFYVSKGIYIHPNVQRQADELLGMLKKTIPDPSVDITFKFITADILFELTNKMINNDFILKFTVNPLTNDTYNFFIGTVKLTDYYKFITDENGELLRHIFEANIRDYQGNVAVNKDIQETLENPSTENFWWLNNGVTIIGSNAKPTTGKEILIHDPEIVNGLQTSTEIYKYFSQNIDKRINDTREVLVRIILPENDDSRDKIIFSTNNQTQIQKSSLRATDVIHRQIEMYFKTRDLFYDRRKNYYKNIGKKTNQIISLPFLSQCLISVLLQRPDSARARPSTLLTDDETYKKLYPQNKSLDVFYNIAFIGKKVDNMIKSLEKYQITQKSDIKFYVIYAVFAKVLKKEKITIKDVVSINLQLFSDELIISTTDEVFSLYMQLGGNDTIAKGPDLIVSLKNQLIQSFTDIQINHAGSI
ncbi:MAG: AIPR family protein [Prevotellaceae bacterium]|nr:AIPR family protein [Prevotellaceae bacterium]